MKRHKRKPRTYQWRLLQIFTVKLSEGGFSRLLYAHTMYVQPLIRFFFQQKIIASFIELNARNVLHVFLENVAQLHFDKTLADSIWLCYDLYEPLADLVFQICGLFDQVFPALLKLFSIKKCFFSTNMFCFTYNNSCIRK